MGEIREQERRDSNRLGVRQKHSGLLIPLLCAPIVALASCGGPVSTQLRTLQKATQDQQTSAHELAKRVDSFINDTNSQYSTLHNQGSQLYDRAQESSKELSALEHAVDLISGRPLPEETQTIQDVYMTSDDILAGIDGRRREEVQARYYQLRDRLITLQAKLTTIDEKINDSKEFYDVLAVLRDSARAVYDRYTNYQSLRKADRMYHDRHDLLETDITMAARNNGRGGKEVALYLFGFKWFGGIFTGYAVSSSTSEQYARLAEFEESEAPALRKRTADISQAWEAYEQARVDLERQFNALIEKSKGYARHSQVLAYRNRLMTDFDLLLQQEERLGDAERLYRTAILDGVTRVSKPEFIKDGRISSISFRGALNAGYSSAIGRAEPPFSISPQFSPSIDYATRILQRSGAGGEDEQRAYRRAEYEATLISRDRLATQLKNSMAELDDDPNINEKEGNRSGEQRVGIMVDTRLTLSTLTHDREQLAQQIEQIKEAISKLETRYAQQGVNNYLTRTINPTEQATQLQEIDSKLASLAEVIATRESVDQQSQDIFRKTMFLRQSGYVLQEALHRLLLFEKRVEQQQELLELKRDIYDYYHDNNGRYASEVTLHLFGLKGLWGVFSGWAPTTWSAPQGEDYQEHKRNWDQQAVSRATERRDIEAELAQKLGNVQANITELTEQVGDLDLQVVLKRLGVDMNRAINEFNIVLQQYKIAYRLYHSTMDLGIHSYANFYADEYVDTETARESAATGNRSPNVTADGVALERERESERFYQAVRNLRETVATFDAIMQTSLEGSISQIIDRLEQRSGKITDAQQESEQLTAQRREGEQSR